jgi:nucleotide-binding universal stress UspA family protein
MLPIKTILHPTDFSDCSKDAFRVACSVARDHHARLIILHVTSMPDLAYKGYGMPGSPLLAEEYLAKVRQDLDQLQPSDPPVPCEHRLEEGEPVQEILRVAAETGTSLIVMGTHGQSGLGHLLMGSVAEQIVRKAPCPVLTLKSLATQPATG